MSATFEKPFARTDMIQLPSGDYIDPARIGSVRFSDKANRTTGQIASLVYIEANGSWFSVPFEDKDMAHEYASKLVAYRNDILRPADGGRPLRRGEAVALIADIGVEG